MPRKPRNSPNPPGRRPKTAQAAAALAEAEATGEPLAEVAPRYGVHPSTAHRAAAPKVPMATTGPPRATQAPAAPIATGPPVDRLRAYVAHDPPVAAVVEQLLAPRADPTDLGGTAREMLAQLWSDYQAAAGTSKRNPSAGRVIDALRELRQHFPPPAPALAPDQVQAELDRLDGYVLARIEEQAPDPVVAADIKRH